MSSSPCTCIVAARHKTGAVVTAFLRKTCSERYALMLPLNEFIGQVHESLASDRARYNGYHATYGLTSVIGTNDKNTTTAIAIRIQRKNPLFRGFFLVVSLCRCFILTDTEYCRFCSIKVNYDH